MEEARDAVRALRSARRRRYREALDWVDALYRAYVLGLVAIVATLLLSGALGDKRATPAALRSVVAHEPALAGCLVAALIAAALRSGSRGGPLALEAPDVHHLLLAPIDRGLALRAIAWRQLRSRMFIGVVAGALVGNLAFRRLPGAPAGWLAAVAALGIVAAAASYGAALLASGRRLAPRLCTALGALLLAWSAADVVLGARTSPATLMARIALLPIAHRGAEWGSAAIGLGVAAALLAAGLAAVGGTSLELSLRRAQLAAVLRFSATIGDLRTVVLLRRQLAAELPRARPWLRLRAGASDPVRRRAWQSFLRWPPIRILRVVVLGVAAGAAAAGAWRGTTPLIAVTGLALLLAAFDAIEPFAEEVDHPTRSRLFPVDARRLARRHLFAPAALMLGVAVVGAATALALGASGIEAEVALVAAIPAAAAVTCAAALSAATDPFAWVFKPAFQYGFAAAPFVIAVGGALPVVAARAAQRSGLPALGAAIQSGLVVVVVCVAVAGYVSHSFSTRTAAG